MSSSPEPGSESERPVITDDGLSPLVQILTWLFLTFSILFVAAEFLTKWSLSRRPAIADGVLLIALVITFFTVI
jgi:hypothetical protein